jgi:ribosomal protein S18 acetylase RimI-like enzyme
MTTLIHSNINKNYIAKLTNIIYHNFLYLKDIQELDHNKNAITNLLTNNTNFYFLFGNNILIGYLIYELKSLQDGRFICYVDYIYISDKYRSKNYGSTMMEALIKYCRDNDIKFMMLTFDTNNKKLLKFYKQKGFKRDDILQTDFDGNQVFTLFI